MNFVFVTFQLIRETEAQESPWVQGQLGLYTESKANLNYIAGPCLKKQTNKIIESDDVKRLSMIFWTMKVDTSIS